MPADSGTQVLHRIILFSSNNLPWESALAAK